MQLRPYQQQQSDLLRESFRAGHKRIILCSPTGSGKSLVMSDMTQKAYEKGSRVILLTHRMELFKSTLSHLGKSGIPCVSITAGSKMPIGDWKVAMCMERTLWNILSRSPESVLPPDLIIADEIHFAHFNKIISHFAGVRLIGFSATPSGKHIHKIYTDIVQNIDIPELLTGGYLVPCRAYQMQDNFDDVKISKGEFEDASLFKHFNKAKLYDGLIEEYKRYAEGKKTIVFCCNVAHTEITAQTMRDAGYSRVYSVHSKMANEERDRMVREFSASTDGIMVNCGILTTGYDEPGIECVIVYRATTSLPLWLQMQGRGSRIAPGKSEFIVLDFGQNHNRHGLWNQPRKWSITEPKKKAKDQAAPVRDCPSCGAMLYASVRKCEFCGHEFPVPTYDLLEGVMVECGSNVPLGLTGKRISDLTLDELITCQKTGKLKHSYVWRTLRTMENDGKGSYLQDYASKMGYKNGWLFSQRQKMQDATQVGFRDYIIR